MSALPRARRARRLYGPISSWSGGLDGNAPGHLDGTARTRCLVLYFRGRKFMQPALLRRRGHRRAFRPLCSARHSSSNRCKSAGITRVALQASQHLPLPSSQALWPKRSYGPLQSEHVPVFTSVPPGGRSDEPPRVIRVFSSSAHVAGLVILRQTFVGRRHRRQGFHLGYWRTQSLMVSVGPPGRCEVVVVVPNERR